MSAAPASAAVALANPRPTLATVQVGGPSSASPATDRNKQQAALASLVRTYTQDIAKGQQADQLTSLAKQIAAAAKALGQNVTLPKSAPPSGPEGGVNKIA